MSGLWEYGHGQQFEQFLGSFNKCTCIISFELVCIYLTVALLVQCCVRLSSSVVCRLSVTLCIVAKRCVLGQKLLYWEPIGSRIWEIDWYQNEWHWPLLRGRIKVTSTIACYGALEIVGVIIIIIIIIIIVVVIALHLMLTISETVRDRGLVPKDHQ